jgi:hypothetical protein
MPDMNYWLGRKYAILQQQADATTAGVDVAAKNAQTNALTGRAAALLDTTRANLLPAESRAGLAKTRAETTLLGEQAATIGPESQARIANIEANTGRTNIDSRIAFREGLRERQTLPASLAAVMGRSPVPSFSLGNIVPETPRRAGESQAAYLDRINGL